MPRLKSLYSCTECGHSTPKWAGQCSECGAWNTLVEEVVEERPAAAKGGVRPLTELSSQPRELFEVAAKEEVRLPTRIGEIDRLLGGGLVRGQVLLMAGPPGIGKSTLMLQIAGSLAQTDKVLYVSGEESMAQVASRARRLKMGPKSITLVSETDLGKILESVRETAPAVLILDSIQTVYHPDLPGGPGSVGQVRECAAELLRAAKTRGIILFILGHVTKEGAVAGPKVLEHLVDTVLQFDTEKRQLLRVVRAEKNRFGPTSEIGFFEMGEEGLKEVLDASAFFIEDRHLKVVSGRAVSVAVEGSRPILAEVQALVTPTRYPLPRRMATGLDLNRTLVLIAALEKHLQLHLENRDIFVNLAGGMRLKDPALDLAVCMALFSSAREKPLPADSVFIGEVGLLGDLSRVSLLPQRLREAARAGFKSAFVAARSLEDFSKTGAAPVQLRGAADIAEAVRCLS